MDQPTHFGEVVDFRSRAVDLDYDDYEEEYEPKYEVSLNLEGGKVLNCNLLIIAIGANACGFIDVYVKKEKFRNIGAVKVKPNDVRVSVSHEKFDAIQLECEGNLVVASCLKNLDNECVSEVANKIFSFFEKFPSCVIVLTSIFTTSYLSDIETPQCEFLNILCNNVDEKFKGELQKKFQTLPVPNVIDGLAAAALTFSQKVNIPAVCFTVITEHLVKDIDTVKAFKPLLKVAQVKSVVQQVKNETERLQMFADSGPLLCPSGNMFV